MIMEEGKMKKKIVKFGAVLLAALLMLVVPSASANIPPVADAEPDYQEANVGETVNFYGWYSYDPDGYIVEWYWEFGDGGYGYGNYTSHVYTAPGYYNVTLTVMDNENATDTDIVGVKIWPLSDYPPWIEVYSPGYSYNESYYQGDTISVYWYADDDNPLPSNPINISYGTWSGTSGNWTTIENDYPNDGYYYWNTSTVPCPYSYWMNLSVYDSIGQTTFGYSNYSFEILCAGDTPPHIEVIEPGGTPGQLYYVGDNITIFWDAYDDNPLPTNPISIFYGNTNGSYMPIVIDYPNFGLYDWNTTGVSPGIYWLKITVYDSIGQTSVDYSTYSFELECGDCPPVPPTLTSAVLSGPDNQDVTINWELSGDDGSGEDDVVEYEIYYSTSYAADGSGYTLLATVAPGTTTYTHAGAGDGDPDNYFYYVQAVDGCGQIGWNGQAGKFVRELRGGYKEMVSIPLVQADTSLLEVIKTITGSYHSLMLYQGACNKRQWVVYKPGWVRDFHIDHKMGFFIKVRKNDDLVVAGLVPESTTISLCQGAWNLIGYPSFTPDTVGNVLSSISHKGVKVITMNRPQHMIRLSDSDMMSAGNGYWIKVLTSQTLVI